MGVARWNARIRDTASHPHCASTDIHLIFSEVNFASMGISFIAGHTHFKWKRATKNIRLFTCITGTLKFNKIALRNIEIYKQRIHTYDGGKQGWLVLPNKISSSYQCTPDLAINRGMNFCKAELKLSAFQRCLSLQHGCCSSIANCNPLLKIFSANRSRANKPAASICFGSIPFKFGGCFAKISFGSFHCCRMFAGIDLKKQCSFFNFLSLGKGYLIKKPFYTSLDMNCFDGIQVTVVFIVILYSVENWFSNAYYWRWKCWGSHLFLITAHQTYRNAQ